MTQRPALFAVVVGGAIAGILDIAFALSFAGYNGVPPTRLLQGIASGLFGDAAFSGGAPMAALGMALHFALSFLWAGLYLLAAGRIRMLPSRPVVSGILFGAVVFFAMRLVVLPLSAFPRPVDLSPLRALPDLLSHMLLFGVPIALAARTAVARRSPHAAR